ncbi:mechanosensitive ion channel [Candidatus Woesearchaeota archaeon]|nr:mechanosensitive ion channel [Candidatus Woesearchaeota archaeon]
MVLLVHMADAVSSNGVAAGEIHVPLQQFDAYIAELPKFIPKLVTTLTILIIVLLVYLVITKTVKTILMKRAKTHHAEGNVKMFLKVWRYTFFVIFILIAALTYSGSLTGFTISVGILTLVLGWAMQKPITGVAAWLMIIVKRPFRIKDRVEIGHYLGDVEDISLLYVTLNEFVEFGHHITGETPTGREILIPTNKLFEYTIINYTKGHDYVADQVIATFTYESDIEKAEKICIEAVQELTKTFGKKVPHEPLTRMIFDASGIQVKVKFFTPAYKREYATLVVKEIVKRVNKAKDVSFAYPHVEVVGKGLKK